MGHDHHTPGTSQPREQRDPNMEIVGMICAASAVIVLFLIVVIHGLFYFFNDLRINQNHEIEATVPTPVDGQKTQLENVSIVDLDRGIYRIPARDAAALVEQELKAEQAKLPAPPPRESHGTDDHHHD